jgi:hypothetical protein
MGSKIERGVRDRIQRERETDRQKEKTKIIVSLFVRFYFRIKQILP